MTDIAADINTTATVAVGGSATGEIETAGDKDWFAVELEAGRTYRFDLQGAPDGHGTLSDTFLRRILDAEGNKSIGDGQHRTYNDDFQGSRDSRVTFTATETGTYYVEASGDRDETGTYRLTVTDVTPEPEAVEPQEGQQQDALRTADVDLGDITSVDGPRWPRDSMDDGNDGSRVFSFTLSEAKTVGLGLRQLDVDADLVLEDAGGTVIAESRQSGTANEWISETLLAGTYYARVEAQAGGANDYRFRYGVTAPDATEVERLEGEQSEGQEPEGQEPERETSRPPFGEIGPPSVSWFEEGFADAQVFPNSEEEPLVSQQQVSGDDYPAGISTTGRVAVGGSTMGEINAPADKKATVDRDWFAVELLAGRIYRIDLEGQETNAGTLPEPLIRGIYDDRSRKVPGTFDHSHDGRGHNDQLVFAPTGDGTYYIEAASATQFVVGSAKEFSLGTYRLSVTEIDRLEVDDEVRSSAKTVEVGEVDNPATGYITTDRERDWFAVELEAGARYQIEMEGVEVDFSGNTAIAEALAKPLIFRVFDEGGNQVDRIEPFRIGNLMVVDIEPPTEGTYYIALARSLGSGDGWYRLSVTKTDDYSDHTGTAGEVVVGGSATGEIETRGDVDWFAVELQTGVEYRIDLLGASLGASSNNGTLTNLDLVGIYDSAGNLIPNTRCHSRRRRWQRVRFVIGDSILDTSGTYYIAAGGGRGHTGTYRVHVSVPGTGDDYTAGPANTGRVEVGGFATGEVETFSDVDWFAVELLAGTHYRIDLKGSSSDNGTWDVPEIFGGDPRLWQNETRQLRKRAAGGVGYDSPPLKFRGGGRRHLLHRRLGNEALA